MKIFECSHSLLGNCVFCRLSRGEIEDFKIYFAIAFIVGIVVGFFGFGK